MSRRRRKELPRPTRRQFLALSGMGAGLLAGADPVRRLISSLVDGLVLEAQAAETGVRPRHFIGLNCFGAPPEYYWSPLAPYAGRGAANPHPMICTRFDANMAPSYATVNVQHNGLTAVTMPYLWGTQIPVTSGQSVPASDLLENAVLVRGMHMVADGHRSNALKAVKPGPGASVNGRVAGRAGAPVGSVSASNGSPWEAFAPEGAGDQTSLFNLPGIPNPLVTVLEPFDTTGDTAKYADGFVSRREALDQALSAAMDELAKYAKSRSPGTESLYELRNRATTLMRTGLGDAATAYPALRDKYNGLIRRCMDYTAMPVAGLTDRVVNPGNRRLEAGVGDTRRYVGNGDLRTVLDPARSFIYELGEGFAVAEYLIKRGITTSVILGPTFYGNCDFNVPILLEGNVAQARELNGFLPFDEHQTGRTLSMVVNCALYRSLWACLYEFIRFLKAESLFDETVIQYLNEFGRIPRLDFGGGDHKFIGNSGMIFSGAIRGPYVVGNVQRVSNIHEIWTNGTNILESAPITVDGTTNSPLRVGNFVSTVCKLLRVTSPTPNNQSLLTEGSGGALVPSVELARNIG